MKTVYESDDIRGLQELSNNISNGTQKCTTLYCEDRVNHFVIVYLSKLEGMFHNTDKVIACCDSCMKFIST